jgi:hypothetical protein
MTPEVGGTFNAVGARPDHRLRRRTDDVQIYDDRRQGKIVDCKISSTAMDQLDRAKGTMPSERVAQFVKHRDEIERIASDLLDKDGRDPVGLICIFYHHIR